jgi:3-isopropylmalate/(R)-2-methylmalate dehydratase large subunit
MGAKAGFMPVDKKTIAWLKPRIPKNKRIQNISADKGAVYESVYEFDVSKLKPMISMPHSVDNVAFAASLNKVKIGEAFLGTCTNGRIDDFLAAAKVLNKRKINPEVKLIIAPSSRQVYLEALRMGLVEIFINAGAVIVAPGCGACVGTHNGIPSDNEAVISTANRNFKGRMGNPAAFIYLASPATVAASALKGYISDPRSYF